MLYDFNYLSITLSAPTRSGVYIILSITGMYIYIGSSTDLRERLLQHHNKTSTESDCIWNWSPSRFAFEQVPALLMFQKERDLIRMYSPLCNQR